MAALLVQRIFQNKGMLQTTTLAMELLLLSTGFFSALLKFKQAINPSSLLEFALSIFPQLGMSYKALFSSSLRIFFFINSVIIILILVSSRFHRLQELDVFVGNNLMDSLNLSTAEIWDLGETLVPDDGAPLPPGKSSKASTFLENLDQELLFLENDVGELITLKDIQVDCFRTLSGTWRVDETPHVHVHNIIEKFSDQENQRPELADEIIMEDTSMEATWNAISRQQGLDDKSSFKLKKSDTWLPPARRVSSLEATWKELRKTVTFNDAVSACRRGGLARDVMSTTSDEMKKRFDDFINNFNNHLRLQRQESQQRLLEAIGPTRGPL